MTTQDDIKTIRTALTNAKSIASAAQYGGLHNLWSQLVEGLEALKRLEVYLLPHQPSLMPPNLTTADTARSYTHKRPEPDTIPPSSRSQ